MLLLILPLTFALRSAPFSAETNPQLQLMSQGTGTRRWRQWYVRARVQVRIPRPLVAGMWHQKELPKFYLENVAKNTVPMGSIGPAYSGALRHRLVEGEIEFMWNVAPSRLCPHRECQGFSFETRYVLCPIPVLSPVIVSPILGV